MPATVPQRVSTLERVVEKLAVSQQAMQVAVQRLSEEMAEFKDEMRQFKEEMRQFKVESELDRKRMNKAWGDLANKLGTIVEDIAAPNIRRLAVEEFGFLEIQDFLIRASVCSRRGMKRNREFDVVCAGPQKVIVAEMKSNASIEAVSSFQQMVSEFFDFFPEYEGRGLIGVFASWSLSQAICDALSQSGLYGIAMGDETMEIVARPARKG